MGGLDLLTNTNFSRNYDWSREVCESLQNSDPEIAETGQTLIKRNIKTERQKITLSKSYNYGKMLIIKKTDNKPSVTERNIEIVTFDQSGQKCRFSSF